MTEFLGTAIADALIGTSSSDTMFGLTGEDTLSGEQGDDTIYGGKDNDILYSGFGNDVSRGDLGDDLVFGNEGDDLLYGGKGNDTILCGDGNDTVHGNLGDDYLIGGEGNNVFIINPAEGKDTILGFKAGDKILDGLNNPSYREIRDGRVDGLEILVLGTDGKLFNPTSTPAVTPTPVVTPRPTLTPIPPVTPGVTPTPEPTVTPTPTPAIAPTPTPGVTPTPTPGVTPTPTPAVTPTPTPAVTPTPAPAVTPTPTPAIAPTPTPAIAPTPTPAVTPTPTPAVTPTPTPAVTPTPTPVRTQPTEFDEKFYLMMNYDATKAISTGSVKNALEHYETVGKAEGRASAPSFVSTFNIEFDYRFDTTGFFKNNPNRQAVLESAATYWESVIQDEFENIPVGTKLSIKNPSTGDIENIVLDREIDDFLIFVGAGPINAAGITYGFDPNAFRDRLDGVNYEPFVGSIAFDTNISYIVDSTPFDFTDTPSEPGTPGPGGGITSLFISAAHELQHALGFSNGTPAFNARINGSSFDGPNARAVNGGNPMPLRPAPDLSHLISIVSNGGLPSLLGDGGGAGLQIPTKVDLSLLADIGYKIDGFTVQDSTRTTATEGNDTVLGTDLGDTLDGLGGNDRIYGVAGNDILTGGAGNDLLYGGGGLDTFVFGAANGQDQLIDFVAADDKIQLAASLGFSSGDAVLAAAGNFFNGPNSFTGELFSRITLSPGNTIEIFHKDPILATNFIIL